MKKLFSVLLILTLLLTGCSKSNEGGSSGDKTVITFWGHQNEAWNESYRNIAKQFMEENEDIEVQLEFFPYGDFESKVQTSLISHEGGADIYELWGGWGVDFAHTGALQKINDELAKNIKEHSYPSTYGALEYDGDLYGLPLEFNIENGGMLVNLKLLEESNVSIPTTWEELRAAAIELTKRDGDNFEVRGFDFVNWDSVPYLLSSMILSQGGQYQDANGRFTFNTAEGKVAFEELISILDDKVTDLEGLVGGGDLEGYQMLYANRAAIVPRGPWVISEGEFLFDLTYGEDFEYAPMPWFKDTPKFAAESGWALAANANTKNNEAVQKFLDFFYQDDILLDHNVKATQIPSKKEVANDPQLIELMPFAEPLIAILDDAQFIGHFNTDVFKETINDAFVAYASGEFASVEDALISIEDTLNE